MADGTGGARCAVPMLGRDAALRAGACGSPVLDRHLRARKPCSAKPSLSCKAPGWPSIRSGRTDACFTNVVEAWNLGGGGQGWIQGRSRSLIIQAYPEGCAAGSEGTMRLVIDAAPDGPRCALSLAAELADPAGGSPVRRLPVTWNYYWGGSPHFALELIAGSPAVSFRRAGFPHPGRVAAAARSHWACPSIRPVRLPRPQRQLRADADRARRSTASAASPARVVVWKASGQRPPVFPGIPSSYR